MCTTSHIPSTHSTAEHPNVLVVGIDNFAFNSCTSLTSIGNEAFAGCNSLININIPDSVNSIGFMAFYECIVLTSINISSSVNKIYAGAFVNTTKLQDITFNWTGKILDDIIQKIKNPVHQKELTTWACIFANVDEKTHFFKDKMNVNVHLPKGINNLDVEKYKIIFKVLKKILALISQMELV